jgi:Zn-dependent M28 family amino/carboxypeptidase
LLIPSAIRIEGDVELTASGMIRDDKKMRNVIGLLRGSDETLQKQAILYSAHLDHLGSNPALTDDQVYNGADDDASGVTAVVTLADAIGAMKDRPKRSVLFMAFWGEESGLLGSKQFVASPSWQLDQIVANINIEMIGRPEGGARGKIWMTGWRESDLGVLMSQAAKPWGIEIFEHPKFSSMLYRSSDNWSFVERGVIAHSFSAGSLHPDYHQVDDEWDRLEIPHMTQVIQGLWLGSLPLLDGTQTPSKATSTKKESK